MEVRRRRGHELESTGFARIPAQNIKESHLDGASLGMTAGTPPATRGGQQTHTNLHSDMQCRLHLYQMEQDRRQHLLHRNKYDAYATTPTAWCASWCTLFGVSEPVFHARRTTETHSHRNIACLSVPALRILDTLCRPTRGNSSTTEVLLALFLLVCHIKR